MRIKSKKISSIIILVLFSLITINAIAADTSSTKFKHDICIGFANLGFSNNNNNFYDQIITLNYLDDYASSVYDYVYFGDYIYKTPSYGISYKLRYKKIGFRLGIEGAYSTQKISETSFSSQSSYYVYPSEASYVYSKKAGNIGVEYLMPFKKVELTTGFDIVYSQSDMKIINTSLPSISYSSMSTSENNINQTTWGFAPLVSLKFYVYNNLYFATETKMLFTSDVQKYNYTSTRISSSSYSSISTSEGTNNATNIKFSPLGLILIGITF